MEANKENRPKVGIGVMVIRDGKVLLGKRKGSHWQGEYAWPGGHLEYMESFEQCARREIREECGIEIANIRFQFLSHIKKYLPKHYVHVGLVADWQSGEPKVMEPKKSLDWEWFDLKNIPRPLFDSCDFAFESPRHPSLL